MSAILNSLNIHNFSIFQPILMRLVSKFMVYRALSDKSGLLSGLQSPLMKTLEMNEKCWKKSQGVYLQNYSYLSCQLL